VKDVFNEQHYISLYFFIYTTNVGIGSCGGGAADCWL